MGNRVGELLVEYDGQAVYDTSGTDTGTINGDPSGTSTSSGLRYGHPSAVSSIPVAASCNPDYVPGMSSLAGAANNCTATVSSGPVVANWVGEALVEYDGEQRFQKRAGGQDTHERSNRVKQ